MEKSLQNQMETVCSGVVYPSKNLIRVFGVALDAHVCLPSPNVSLMRCTSIAISMISLKFPI